MQELTKNTKFTWNNFTFHIYNTQQRIQPGNTEYNNAESLVTSIKNNNHSALITGDIQQIKNSDNYYLAIAKDVVSEVGHLDIYKASHHGLAGNNPANVMNTLKPDYVIITNNKENASVNIFINRTVKPNGNVNPKNVLWTQDKTYIFDVTNAKMKLLTCKTGVNC